MQMATKLGVTLSPLGLGHICAVLGMPHASDLGRWWETLLHAFGSGSLSEVQVAVGEICDQFAGCRPRSIELRRVSFGIGETGIEIEPSRSDEDALACTFLTDGAGSVVARHRVAIIGLAAAFAPMRGPCDVVFYPYADTGDPTVAKPADAFARCCHALQDGNCGTG